MASRQRFVALLAALPLGLLPRASAQVLPPAPAPASLVAPASAPAQPGLQPAVAPGAPDPTAREKDLLERIRVLKTPRLRSYGTCRYDWGGWRLNEKGVRSTSSECGNPPIRGTVAVFCDTLQINRRVEEGPWEGWRLPYSVEESPTLGGEDRLVASLCANVRNAGGGVKPRTPPPLSGTVTPRPPAAPGKPVVP
jgi:hypothetical protein